MLYVHTDYISLASLVYLHHGVFRLRWAPKPIDPNKAAAEVGVGKIGIAQSCALHPWDCG